MTLVSLAAGGEYTCGLTAAGAAYCWGSNSNSQLGNGTIGGTNVAAGPVSGGLTFVSLSAGGAHTCGVTPDGSIYCPMDRSTAGEATPAGSSAMAR